MKKFLPLMAGIFIYATANAQTGSLLINDNFTTLTAGDLSPANNAASGWTSPGNSPYIQVTNSSPLVSSGYASGTNYITVANTNSADDPYKNFIGSTSVTTAAPTFYISFVVRTPALSTTATAGASTNHVLTLRNSGGNNLCSFYLGDDGTNLEFGIAKGSGASSSTVFTNGNYSFNTTYLIVMRYDFVSGSTNDRMFMWVNPTLSAEPATGTAAVSITGATTDPTAPNSSAITALQLQQSSSASAAHFDGIKAAYATGGATQAANSGLAWSNLSPAGATLPIKVYYFNAAKGNGYNTINWRADCSAEQATFVIERSANGFSFAPVNTITASQTRCLQPFDYTDNTVTGQGTLYYRLKMIDINGKAAYSSIVKLSAQESAVQLLGVAPNPVVNTAQLSIVAVKKDLVDVQIISLEGKMVHRSTVAVQPGTSMVAVDVANLQAGVYTIKAVFGSGAMSTVKFVK